MTAAPQPGHDRVAERRVRVMEVLDPPDGRTAQYADQVTAGMGPSVDVRWFSWRRGLTTRYDVLHLHWPEQLLRGGNRVSTWANRAAFVVLVLRCRLLGVPMVQTAHNVRPHEPRPGVEEHLLRWYRRHLSAVVRLNASTPPQPGTVDVLVGLGHYRQAFARHPQPPSVPGRLLSFGIIRPYKNVPALLAAFAGLDGDVSLHVVGRAADDEVRRGVVEAAARDPRVRATLDFVGDDVLVREVCESALVVLPYREMNNSGAVLVALSLARPVLAPRSAVNEELVREVGPGWLHLYDGDLTTRHLREALAAGVPPGEPRLVDRDEATVGARHAALFHLLHERRPRGARRGRTRVADRPS
ncbi:glycosyltransferase [Cellulomonas marina]|uniref:Beta-1,4-mannosyltransferase n=1 Tax=Cellulomonas marina TaxID=988821 RepID=A0A1I0X3V3_9CELL|nr:glycosyltransferase [Cellulomonas marina]GIG28930.1 GDP-mannose:glycolipid 4-beta-D-mannosyltransferase [Cellulomonas marina]SFA95675.1 beta-1,4-mannosyltransferase&\